jgi:hypothetical protein
MNRNPALWVSLALVGALSITALHSLTVAADPTADPDAGANPALRVVSVVHGMTFTLDQREVESRRQGPTIMITHVHAAVPPGPPNLEGAVPPGPPNIDLVVRSSAPDMEVAHAAGALTALGLMQGLTLPQLTNTFEQLGWGIHIETVKGQVDPRSQIDSTRAGALAELTIAAIIAGDRPGGGCDAAIPFIEQGAAALGFAPTCAPPANIP